MHTDGMIRGSLTHQGRERTYLLRESTVPTDAVLIYFHGSQQSGSVGRKFTNNTFDAVACHVVYPDGVEQHWNDARIGLHEKTRDLGVDDVGFVTALLARLHGYLGFSRVFLAGYSNGGQMVMRLMHEVPKLITGAATIAANMPTPDNTLPEVLLHKPRPIPYITMAGTADPFSPFTGGDAGIGRQHRRGNGYSAADTAAYFAARNGLGAPVREIRDEVVTVDRWAGEHPVEFWTLNGIGHLVPSGRSYPDFLGPNTDRLIAAAEISRFFGLGYREQPEH